MYHCKESHGDKHIKWDEDVIQEHDKERGTRQKIDEPPTPYSYVNTDVDETEHPNHRGVQHDLSNNWEALNAKLHFEAQQQQMKDERADCGEVNDPDEFGHKESSHSSVSFADHRAAHYNEFLVLKAMREKMAMEDVDEDES